MITTFLLTGDTHAEMSRFKNLSYQNPSEIGIIILGDAGCNYFLTSRDHKTKMALEKTGYNYYLVRGNHEERPENIDTMIKIYDEDVVGDVYMELDYPHIKYLIDGNVYCINDFRTLVIGGAYSVDKMYRLQMGYQWFPDELLTKEEMDSIYSKYFGEHFDFILSHTCPRSWEPVDLFLPIINQDDVDKSMEDWMDRLKEDIHWDVWCFGHFHRDRLERPGVEMYYKDMEEMETVWNRWHSDVDLSWWLIKGPNYYNED